MEEIDAMKKEYEAVISRVKDEYQNCNDTLRKASES